MYFGSAVGQRAGLKPDAKEWDQQHVSFCCRVHCTSTSQVLGSWVPVLGDLLKF